MKIDETFSLPNLLERTSSAGQSEAGNSFSQIMSQMVRQANDTQLASEKLQVESMTGGNVNPGEVEVAIVRAELALETIMSIRNRLVESFNELRQMQI